MSNELESLRRGTRLADFDQVNGRPRDVAFGNRREAESGLETSLADRGRVYVHTLVVGPANGRFDRLHRHHQFTRYRRFGEPEPVGSCRGSSLGPGS
jgi:hypothetical protein